MLDPDLEQMMVARDKIRTALEAITDTGSVIDSGAGMGSADLWPKIDGVEYYVEIRRSNAQQAKDAAGRR